MPLRDQPHTSRPRRDHAGWNPVHPEGRYNPADPVGVDSLIAALDRCKVPLWGTDSVWYGPPQPQIMAFRAFNVSQEFQHRYRYAALTDTIKAEVLGLNAARLFAVDPQATRCALAADKLELHRKAARGLAAEGALPLP